MIDIHTHLHFKDYDADRDEVISRAREAGVEKMILVGTDLESSRAAIALSEKYGFLFVSVGVHPHSFNEIEGEITNTKSQIPNKYQITNSEIQNSGSRIESGMTEEDGGRENWTQELREIAKHPKVVAIGECGLDYFVRKEQGTGSEEQETISDKQKAIQREGFLAQMEIAKESGLPMIIHTRPSAGTMDAYEDVFEILKNHLSRIIHPASGFILHCYQGDTEVTKKFLGFPSVYFSFAGNITYPVKKSLVGTKNDILETVKLVPLDRLFVETDCPYLPPQEKRGTRNEPAYATMTAAKAANEKDVSIGKFETVTRESFHRIFHADNS